MHRPCCTKESRRHLAVLGNVSGELFANLHGGEAVVFDVVGVHLLGLVLLLDQAALLLAVLQILVQRSFVLRSEWQVRLQNTRGK